jgi:hypothetical protein
MVCCPTCTICAIHTKCISRLENTYLTQGPSTKLEHIDGIYIIVIDYDQQAFMCAPTKEAS